MQFPDIVLLDDEKKMLKKFSNGSPVHLTRKQASPLMRYNFIEPNIVGINENRMEVFDGYIISDTGKRYLQYRRSTRNNFWIKNAWIPIIVAFATTVLTNYMLPKLPLIIEWLTRILAKIFS